jgi:cation transport ATPase
MGAEPPPFNQLLAVVGVCLLVGIFALASAISYFGFLLVAFGCTVYLAPAITYYLTQGRKTLIRPVVNSAILIILLIIYDLWLLTISTPARWLASGIGLIILVNFGAYFINRHRSRTLKRLSKGTIIRNRDTLVSRIEDFFVRQSLIYR